MNYSRQQSPASIGAPPSDVDQMTAERALVWFEANGRDLPWRRTREAWPILVSELMLQQTQVTRVVARWPQFLNRFPTPTSCAASPRGDVIDAWSGLGYNRRAVNLHRAAIVMVERHDGKVPEEFEQLVDLPGIGPYTARAVRVFAYESNDGVVDTNVARILARTGNARLTLAAAQRLADSLVPEADGWRWNQMLFDVGSLFCRPKDPGCADCPLRTSCLWHIGGHSYPDPSTDSAGVSTGQTTFAGSDRQGRGLLVKALRGGEVRSETLAATMGWPEDDARARRVAATLIGDGLVIGTSAGYRLPGYFGSDSGGELRNAGTGELGE